MRFVSRTPTLKVVLHHADGAHLATARFKFGRWLAPDAEQAEAMLRAIAAGTIPASHGVAVVAEPGEPTAVSDVALPALEEPTEYEPGLADAAEVAPPAESRYPVALDDLTDDDRAEAVARALEGEDYADIAHDYSVKPATVKRWVSARQKSRKRK